MASTTINGIFFTYPNAPCPVFNPCIVTVGHTVTRIQVWVNSIYATYQAKNGDCTVDIRAFLQSGFDNLRMGRYQLAGQSDLGKSVPVTIKALDADNTVLAQLNTDIFCVWAGLAPGETYESPSKLTMFHGYEFNVGRYFPSADEVDFYRVDNLGNRTLVLTDEAGSQGIWYYAIDTLDDTRQVIMCSHANNNIVYADIQVVQPHYDGVYLRWVDRHGFWCYWLFKKGDPSVTAASKFGAYDHINYNDYNVNHQNWRGVSGRRQSLTRTDTIPLCAPLVDQETYDMLQDVTTSPCVDMAAGFDGYGNEIWTAVTVQPGTYTKDVKKPEQDFLLNLILTDIPVQTL